MAAELAKIDKALALLEGGAQVSGVRTRKMSARGRKAISEAAKKRWARYRAAQRKAGK